MQLNLLHVGLKVNGTLAANEFADPTKSEWMAACSADGTRAYVANRNDNNVSVIDTTTQAVLRTVPVGTRVSRDID